MEPNWSILKQFPVVMIISTTHFTLKCKIDSKEAYEERNTILCIILINEPEAWFAAVDLSYSTAPSCGAPTDGVCVSDLIMFSTP